MLLNIGNVRNDEVNTRHRFVWKGHTSIDHNQVVIGFVGHDIFTDLT